MAKFWPPHYLYQTNDGEVRLGRPEDADECVWIFYCVDDSPYRFTLIKAPGSGVWAKPSLVREIRERLPTVEIGDEEIIIPGDPELIFAKLMFG